MVKFAHLADCHLGGWKQPELQELNLASFRKAIDICIQEKVEFIVFAGDLFDSAYPPIEILKETFAEFRRIKEAKIQCFIVAGSHDYSVSGKTFLDVLEKAGFCKNVESYEVKQVTDENGEEKEIIVLNPTVYGNIAFYGYPGKKASLEIDELKRIKFNDSPGMFKVFLLHTTITSVKGTLPIESIDEHLLPKADYYALGHIHLVFRKDNFIYPGPVFPNNFQELQDLEHGTFFIIETGQSTVFGSSANNFTTRKIDLKLKEVENIEIEIDNTIEATRKVMEEINSRDLKDKIVLLRIKGDLTEGKTTDISFSEIEALIQEKGAYCFLKNINGIKIRQNEIQGTLQKEVSDVKELENNIIYSYSDENPSKFNDLIPQLVNALSIEKQEDEKSIVFENRLMAEVKKLLNI